MNSENGLNLLHDNLDEFFDERNAETFVQDGAPCHTMRIVKEWFEICEQDFFKDWPP